MPPDTHQIGPMQTDNGNKVYEVAKSLLGKDASPADKVPDGLACAETVNYIVQHAIGYPVGGGTSTYAMWQCLEKFTTRFKKILAQDALPGDIIMSPTGSVVNSRLKHGHVGIVAKYGILSNNSEDGKLEENYTIDAWSKYFNEYGGLPVYFYRIL